MRFNRLGEASFGVGDGIPSLRLNDRGVVLVLPPDKTGSGGQWLDDDNVIYQTHGDSPDGEIIESMNVRTFKRTLRASFGVNAILGGGGKFALWGSDRGMTGDFQSAIASPLAASRDGAFLIRNNYQSGDGAKLFAPDGRVTDIADNYTYGEYVIDGTTAIWCDANGEFRTLNMPVPLQVGPTGNPTVATIKGEDWIAYFVEGVGLVLHPTRSLVGYILETSGHAYNHDIVSVNDKLRIGWSLTSGEGPDDQVVFDMDLSQPRIDLSQKGANGGVFIPATPAAFRESTTSASSRTDVANTTNSSALIQPQLGLLEDDIVYRLALLAVNVLQPLKDEYPNIVIKSGFRQVNSGISQHETGEAVDVQINNQTPELLYEVANWMQHNLPFDQLVLNFTNIGDAQPWIHVSFSPQSLRQQVLTKDFADTFHEGLFFVDPLTGEDAAQASRDQDALDALIFNEMKKSSARSAKLIPISTVTDEVSTILTGAAAAAASGTSGSGSGSSGSGSEQDNTPLVACVQTALALPGTGNVYAFEVTKRVAWLLKNSGCGLLTDPTGVAWNGYIFSPDTVCFPDGTTWTVLSGSTPTWTNAGSGNAERYVPAMDPGSDINMNWLQCAIPSGDSPDNPRVTSSLDPDYLRAAIRASFAGTNGGAAETQSDSDYWYGLASNPAQFSDGVWRIGWNRYWESRMDPNNDGSSNPAWGDLPAIYQPK